MSFFRNTTSASLSDATSTLIYRTGTDVVGVREAIDESPASPSPPSPWRWSGRSCRLAP